MDPLAHTLVGASIAEAGPGRRTAFGGATAIIGANLPDMDAVLTLAGTDASLGGRRGWTHGVLAVAVLPVALAAAMVGLDRWRRARAAGATAVAVDPATQVPSARWGPLLVLAYVSVLSHPFLDWLNTYGVRLLAPFDFTWRYGDALFIVDPWLWLLAGTPAVLARSKGKLSVAAWIAVAAAATALVVSAGVVPVPMTAKIVWLLGVSLIVTLRQLGRGLDVRPVATLCLALLAGYVATMIVGTRIAVTRTAQWLVNRGIQPDVVVGGPLPARPVARDVIVRVGDTYRFYETP
jgi:inner membrane protein